MNRSSTNNQISTDPLEYFMHANGFATGNIAKVVTGSKYTAVMLKNRNIGVCANLGVRVDPRLPDFFSPNLSRSADRIIYNAYLNASLNTDVEGDNDVDICDLIDFANFKHISMIGFFKPVIDRLKIRGIECEVFDLMKKEAGLASESKKQEYLGRSDAIILTSTSVSNHTFPGIMSHVATGSNVYMLGPSSIMDPYFQSFGNIRMIFGTCFLRNDERVLEVIGNDGGTRDFQKFGIKKVFTISI